MPFIIKAVEGEEVFELNAWAWAFTVIQSIGLGSVMLVNYYFIMTGLVDFSRRLFTIKTLTAVITLDKAAVPF